MQGVGSAISISETGDFHGVSHNMCVKLIGHKH